MSDGPIVHAPIMSTLTPWSPESIGSLLAIAGLGMNQIAAAGGTWTAQRVMYLPWWLDEPAVVRQLFFSIGTTGSSGNADMGIYNAEGVRLVNQGSTAVGTASTIQTLNITDTKLDQGLYYLAFWCDSATPTFRRVAPTARFLAALGVWEQSGQTSLPATATFAACSVGIVPLIGLTTQSVM